MRSTSLRSVRGPPLTRRAKWPAADAAPGVVLGLGCENLTSLHKKAGCYWVRQSVLTRRLPAVVVDQEQQLLQDTASCKQRGCLLLQELAPVRRLGRAAKPLPISKGKGQQCGQYCDVRLAELFCRALHLCTQCGPQTWQQYCWPRQLQWQWQATLRWRPEPASSFAGQVEPPLRPPSVKAIACFIDWTSQACCVELIGTLPAVLPATGVCSS